MGDIYDACRDALKAEGLMTYHQTFESDQGVGIACTLFHAESGQFIRTFLPLKTGTAQQTGSEITYMRRYTIQCVLSLEGEFDDDGNEAQQIREKKTSDIEINDDANIVEFISEKDANIIKGLIDQTKTDIKKFCQHHDIPSLFNMPLNKFDDCKNSLEEKLKLMSKKI